MTDFQGEKNSQVSTQRDGDLGGGLEMTRRESFWKIPAWFMAVRNLARGRESSGEVTGLASEGKTEMNKLRVEDERSRVLVENFNEEFARWLEIDLDLTHYQGEIASIAESGEPMVPEFDELAYLYAQCRAIRDRTGLEKLSSTELGIPLTTIF